MRRSLLVAMLMLAAIAGAGWAFQALALVRPSAAQLELVDTLRTLDGLHGSQASVVLDGRRYRTSCNQEWDPAARTFRVVVDPGLITETGTRLSTVQPRAEGEFELAGCPRALLAWLSSELARGASVQFRPTTAGERRLDQVELRPRSLPLDVYVAPSTRLPVRLELTASRLRGTSVLRYGDAR